MRTVGVDTLVSKDRTAQTIIDFYKICFIQPCVYYGKKTACIKMNGETLVLSKNSSRILLKMFGLGVNDTEKFLNNSDSAFVCEDD